MKYLVLALLVVTISACDQPDKERKEVPTVNQQLVLARVELSKLSTDFVVDDQVTVDKIQSFFATAFKVDVSVEQFSSPDSCKIGLIHSDGNLSRYYMLDLKNGFVTVAAKTDTPVFKLEQPEKLNEVLRDAGWLIENAE